MAAPSILGAEAPYTGRAFGDLVEACLRERGLTNSAYSGTDATYTAASTAQVNQAKACVQDALVFLQDRRSEWWSLSEASVTAESDYTRVYLPLDFNTFGRGGAFINGKRLLLLSTEQYAANIRPTNEGGGVKCADVSGDPTHARIVQTTYDPGGGGAVQYRFALDVFPRQTSAWTALLLYRAGAKAITDDTTIVRVPVRLHQILENLCRAGWRMRAGDAKGAMEFRALAMEDLEDVRDLPGDEVSLIAKSGLPTETAQRY